MNEPKTPLIPAKLIKDHEHAGQKKLAGETIHVTEPEHAWLLRKQIIDAPKGKVSDKTEVAK